MNGRERRCVYCGARLGKTSRVACRAHRDLLLLDPYYPWWWRQ